MLWQKTDEKSFIQKSITTMTYPIYQEYASTHGEGFCMDMWHNISDSDLSDNAAVLTIFSVALACQHLLQHVRNDAISTNNVWIGRLIVIAVEGGFILNTVFAIVEAVLRIAAIPLLAIAFLFIAPFDGCQSNSTSDVCRDLIVLNLMFPSLVVAQSAISSWTNCRYPGAKINYQGQAFYHLYAGSTTDR